jgi:hypothetical protein
LPTGLDKTVQKFPDLEQIVQPLPEGRWCKMATAAYITRYLSIEEDLVTRGLLW